MKSIINGRVYNTDTADLVFTLRKDTIHHSVEKLYRTKKGSYFFVLENPLCNHVSISIEAKEPNQYNGDSTENLINLCGSKIGMCAATLDQVCRWAQYNNIDIDNVLTEDEISTVAEEA